MDLLIGSYFKSAKIEAKIARDVSRRDPDHTSHCYHLYCFHAESTAGSTSSSSTGTTAW